MILSNHSNVRVGMSLFFLMICVLLSTPAQAQDDQQQVAILGWFEDEADESSESASDSKLYEQVKGSASQGPVEKTPAETSTSSPAVDESYLAASEPCLPDLAVSEITHESISSCMDDSNSPDIFLRQMTERCLDLVKKNQSRIKVNRDAAFAIVKTCALPYMDQQRMGALALGHAWRDASKSQRQTFIELFANKVMEDYQHAIAAYDNQYVKFTPLASRVWKNGQKIVKVRSVIKGGGNDIPVQYRVIRSSCLKGQCWMIYDFVVNDISMVQSYKSQFKGTVSSEGVAGLIKKLQDKKP